MGRALKKAPKIETTEKNKLSHSDIGQVKHTFAYSEYPDEEVKMLDHI